jgi:hypothetical protein
VPVATSARFGFNLVTNAQKVVSSIFPKTWPEDRESAPVSLQTETRFLA